MRYDQDTIAAIAERVMESYIVTLYYDHPELRRVATDDVVEIFRAGMQAGMDALDDVLDRAAE